MHMLQSLFLSEFIFIWRLLHMFRISLSPIFRDTGMYVCMYVKYMFPVSLI